MENQEVLDEELEEISGGGLSLVVSGRQARALEDAGLIVNKKIDSSKLKDIHTFLSNEFEISGPLNLKYYPECIRAQY